MNNQYIPEQKKKTRKSLTSGKKLAEILDVSPSTLSEAVKKGYNCCGYPVMDWAEFNRFGRVEGYDVPENLYNNENDDLNRDNPESVDSEENENSNIQRESIVNNYSLLPTDENYANPVGFVSLSMVLKQALNEDNPQSRAIVSGALAMLGAITAHSVTESGVAAGVGAGVGLGIALHFYNEFSERNTGAVITDSLNACNSQNQIKSCPGSANSSDFLD